MTSNNPLLERVRKLLAKAEARGVTPAEAEALTAKAAELMARYGIDRALLAARQPETDQPADRKIDIGNPWARVQAHLLCGLASAMRCQCVILPRSGPGTRIHMFGFASDIERAEVNGRVGYQNCLNASAWPPYPQKIAVGSRSISRRRSSMCGDGGSWS
jgi:hypothetical protein